MLVFWSFFGGLFGVLMMHNLLKILLLSGLMSSCGLLGHRDFYDEMEFSAFEEPMFMPGREFDVVSGDDGRAFRSQEEIYNRTPATQKDKELYSYQNSIKYELYALENRQSDADYHDYLKVRDEFSSDSERIYFLRLSSARERQQYLRAKGINLADANWSQIPLVASTRSPMANIAATHRAVELGMRPDDVKSAWGRPMRRDIAGQDEQGNERWTYQMGNRVKYIYFEGGRVQGWSEQ